MKQVELKQLVKYMKTRLKPVLGNQAGGTETIGQACEN